MQRPSMSRSIWSIAPLSALTFSASAISPEESDFAAEAMASSHIAPISMISRFNSKSCSSNLFLMLTKPSCDVIFGTLILGLREDIIGLAELYQLTKQEERSVVRNTDCLLHIVGHHNDGVLLFQF